MSRPSELPLEEIWEQHIMTNFEKNWDYMKHRPVKKLKKQEEPKNQKDAFQTFFLCFSSNKRNSGGLS